MMGAAFEFTMQTSHDSPTGDHFVTAAAIQ
jgi:hypothetical protein